MMNRITISKYFVGALFLILSLGSIFALPSSAHANVRCITAGGTQCPTDNANVAAAIARAGSDPSKNVTCSLEGSVWTCSDSLNTNTNRTEINANDGTSQKKPDRVSSLLTSCQDLSWWNVLGGVKCAIVEILFVTIPATIISVFAGILDFTGYLFDAVVNYSIINWNASFGALQSTIITIWALFRDLANITLIGFFVFIAISIILGNHSYGDKKLIARVLVVAVLINFSFLFSTMAITFGNNIAVSFYDKAVKGLVSDASACRNGSSNSSSNADTGIAASFRACLGIKDFSNTTKTLTDISNASDSYTAVIWHMFILCLFITLAAIVILYGALLLLGRFLSLIILTLLSSLAFATYLIPGLASGGFGWNAWWRQLLQNSFLAPIMLVFIWISLEMARVLVAGGNTIANTSNEVGASAASATGIISYIIILGFLFAGMYIAKSLSSGFAQRIASAGAGTVVAAGTAGTGAFLRGTLGSSAASLHSAAKNAGFQNTSGGRLIMGGLDRVQKSSFNALANKNVGKAVTGTGAFTFGGENAGKGGIVGVRHEKAAAAVKIAKDLAPKSDPEKNRAKAAAQREVEQSMGMTRSAAEAQKAQMTVQKNMIEAAVTNAATQAVGPRHQQERQVIQQTVDAHETEARAQETARAPLAEAVRTAEQAAAQAAQGGDAAAQAAAATQLTQAKNALAGQDATIADVHQRITESRQQLAALNVRHAQEFEQAKNTELQARSAALAPVTAALSQAQSVIDAIDKATKAAESGEALARNIAKSAPSNYFGVFGEDSGVAHDIEHIYDENGKKARRQRVIDSLDPDGTMRAAAAGGGAAGGGDHH